MFLDCVSRRIRIAWTTHVSDHRDERSADGAQPPGVGGKRLRRGRKVHHAGREQVADAGADFYVCPDNTAHIVLEQIADDLPLPGLHIADVVCHEIARAGTK